MASLVRRNHERQLIQILLSTRAGKFIDTDGLLRRTWAAAHTHHLLAVEFEIDAIGLGGRVEA